MGKKTAARTWLIQDYTRFIIHGRMGDTLHYQDQIISCWVARDVLIVIEGEWFTPMLRNLLEIGKQRLKTNHSRLITVIVAQSMEAAEAQAKLLLSTKGI